jgi:AAHS family 4-hydroxybenzoate transporter-like MFS transporter
MASHGPSFDLESFIDGQRVGRIHFRVVALCFLVMLSDGYDLQAAAFSAPGIIRSWHVSRADLGPMLSASLFGMLFGGPILASIGDRWGRRTAIVLGSLIYGTFTLISALWAESLTALVVLRFLTGIGLGGLPGTCVALTAEYAPKRVRATLIVIMYLGITLGSVVPAGVSAYLGGDEGWRILLFIGGVSPILFALIAWVGLPESPKFLAGRSGNTMRIERLLTRMQPGFRFEPGTEIHVHTMSMPRKRSRAAMLFADGLAPITLLIWLLFVINLTTNFFLHSWMPLLFRDLGFSAQNAAMVTSLYDIGGIFGALIASRLMDRWGVLALTIYFVIACPMMTLIGIHGLSPLFVEMATFMTGFAIVGIQLGLSAMVGVLYPTEIRATAGGYAIAVGRFGGIAGPMIGALIISLGLSTFQFFVAPVILMAIGAGACFALTQICIRRFGSRKLDEKPLDRLAGVSNVVPDAG